MLTRILLKHVGWKYVTKIDRWFNQRWCRLLFLSVILMYKLRLIVNLSLHEVVWKTIVCEYALKDYTLKDLLSIKP